MDLIRIFADYTIPPSAEFGHRIASFGETAEDYKRLAETDLICPRKRGFIRISGRESKKFLQGQVTCDLESADHYSVFKGAHCTPKGKIIFTFFGHYDEDEDIILETHPSLTDMAIKSLQKYAPFFETSIRDISEEQQSFIMTGPKMAKVLSQRVKESFPITSSVTKASASRIHHIGKGIYSITFKINDIWRGASLLNNFRPIGEDFADLLLVRTGFAEVTEFTTDLFIPQMLNLDRLNFIDFAKGCYTGQEIIARAHYRGIVKRRIRHLLCALTKLPKAGDTINNSNGKSMGSIASVARSSPKNFELLAVISDSASEFSGLQINQEAGVDARELQLAY